MIKYNLMHRDSICGSIIIDEADGKILGYKDNGDGLSPYLGNANVQNMKKWWNMRAVPANRAAVQQILKENGYVNTEIYLAKNLALSMTDSYWLCPTDADFKYDNVKFTNLKEYSDNKIPYHNDSSYDYNASLGGQLEKYWNLEEDIPVLVKECTRYDGQQSVNEVIATKIHELQNTSIPFVHYTAEKVPGHGIISKCLAFTSDNVELISAYEIVESEKSSNDKSLYDHYISVCTKHGIDAGLMQDFMDYQTLTDFIISNTDEHLNNFGVLRDSSTMQLIGPAPIFDSGNSMFFDMNPSKPLSRVQLLERNIVSFYKTEEKMLEKVQNKNIVKLDLLPDPSDIKELYTKAGICEEKAEFISRNYETKIEMAIEFQQGRKISLYSEKNKEKQLKHQKPVHDQKFIMLCGVPGSGKTDKATAILNEEIKSGKTYINSSELYSVTSAIMDSSFIIDKEQILHDSQPDKNNNTVTLVSISDIRTEISQHGEKPVNDLAFLIAEIRIAKAFQMGADVIYDASNITVREREKYINIAKQYNINNLKLYVMDPSNIVSTDYIDEHKMTEIKNKFSANYPDEAEGWTNIEVCEGKYEQIERDNQEEDIELDF